MRNRSVPPRRTAVPRTALLPAAGGVRRRVRVRLRRLPARGLRPRRGRLRRAGRRPDRGRQDHRRRVRGLPRAAAGPQGVLHDADQGAVEPEVRRPRPPPRRRERRPAHRRQLDQLRGAGRRHDDRGPAEHDLRGLAHARQPRLRRHGRGPLPRRPVPRRGVGRGHHRPRRLGAGRGAVGDGEQRRGVRRVARRRARRDGGRRLRAPPRPALPARARRPHPLRPVRRRRADRPPRRRARARRGQPRRCSRSPARSPSTSATTRGDRAGAAARASGTSRTAAAPTAGRAASGPGRTAGRARRWCRAGPTWSSSSTAPRCCPPSSSSSPATAATRAVRQLLGSGRHADAARGAERDRRGPQPPPQRARPGRPAGAGLPALRRGADPRHRRPPRRDAARVQGAASRSASCAA